MYRAILRMAMEFKGLSTNSWAEEDAVTQKGIWFFCAERKGGVKGSDVGEKDASQCG